MPTSPAAQNVLLVHGIWNARHWLAPFALRLRREGLAPELFGYASILAGAETGAERLVEHLRRKPTAWLVGHSLGGLVILEALRRAPDLPVERVVCLGSPLNGSGVAAALGDRPGLSWALGRSRDLLVRGCAPWDGRAEVGVVAGGHARGVGGLFTRMDGPSDGTVAVSETRLPGIADHCVVPASHTGLVLSAEAARRAARFLRHGRFAG
ncbi:esterase/lipase family protein [Lysobacter brunescens]|uniref:Esterase/lipase family protein n=1 Tax=Lysobacter brunescens TaxID=262323 RepID=A0ABW2YB71_9GAMM